MIYYGNTWNVGKTKIERLTKTLAIGANGNKFKLEVDGVYVEPYPRETGYHPNHYEIAGGEIQKRYEREMRKHTIQKRVKDDLEEWSNEEMDELITVLNKLPRKPK